jgi:outer membrane immunogenic protein
MALSIGSAGLSRFGGKRFKRFKRNVFPSGTASRDVVISTDGVFGWPRRLPCLRVGGGAEYAFADNWSLKGEYLYMDFGTYSYSSPLIAATAPFGPGYSWSSSVREREQLVRVGLNYKFNWSPLPGKY